MKEDTRKRIEVAANLAIIITAVLLCGVLTKYLISKPEFVNAKITSMNQSVSRTNGRPTQIAPGTKLSIDGVDWAKNGQTLLLAVSDKCHFCTESAPFYQRLNNERRNTRIVVVVPQTEEEGRQYLSKLNVSADEVKQASFSSLGVRGTPTLVLVDNYGSVIKSWVGKLPSDGEAEVLASLH